MSELAVAVGQRKDQGMCEQQKQRACWCLHHNSRGSVSGGGPGVSACPLQVPGMSRGC